MSTNSGAKKIHWPFVDNFFMPGTATNLRYIRRSAKNGEEHMSRVRDSCSLFLSRRFLASVIDAIVFPIFPRSLEPVIVREVITELPADGLDLKQIFKDPVSEFDWNA